MATRKFKIIYVVHICDYSYFFWIVQVCNIVHLNTFIFGSDSQTLVEN